MRALSPWSVKKGQIRTRIRLGLGRNRQAQRVEPPRAGIARRSLTAGRGALGGGPSLDRLRAASRLLQDRPHTYVAVTVQVPPKTRPGPLGSGCPGSPPAAGLKISGTFVESSSAAVKRS